MYAGQQLEKGKKYWDIDEKGHKIQVIFQEAISMRTDGTFFYYFRSCDPHAPQHELMIRWDKVLTQIFNQP